MSISAINLGNSFTNTNGTSVLSGFSSGLNTQSVINSIVSAQSSQITKLNDQVTVNNGQVAALGTLQTLLTQLQTASTQLSDPQSPEASANVFAGVTTNVTSNTSQAASNFITASAAADTQAGSYTISNISQLATATKQQTSTTFTSTTASIVADTATSGKFTAGTYTITGPKGSGTVTLSDTDTINDVADAFNNASSTTGIGASVLQTSPGIYTLVFTGTSTGGGGSYNFDLSDASGGTTVNDGSGNPLSLGDINFGAVSAGTNAEFELNGTTITRPTNTVSDLVSGLTINLLQDTSTQAGASFTLQVAPDTSSIQTAITHYAAAYNAFLTFYTQQTALNSSGTPASSAILYSDTTLQNVYNQLTTQAASIVTGLKSGSPNQFSDIGISFASTAATSTTPSVSNTLSIDSTTLLSALQNNLSGVENVFGYNLSSSSANLASFQGATDPTVSSFKVNVVQSSSPASYSATYTDTNGAIQTINLSASTLGVGGVALTAPSDSALAGLILIYSGTGDESNINVTTSLGIAAKASNFLASALTANTGLIASDESAIATRNTTLATQITNVTTQVNNTRTELLQKFANLEAAISQANSSLNLLNAQQSAATASG